MSNGVAASRLRAQEILAAKVAEGNEEHAFHVLMSRNLTSENAQIMLADKITSGILAYVLLKGCRVTSHGAQELLACVLKESQLSDRATELLLHGCVDSDRAKEHIASIVPGDRLTLMRVIRFGDIPPEVRISLSARLPPIYTMIAEN